MLDTNDTALERAPGVLMAGLSSPQSQCHRKHIISNLLRGKSMSYSKVMHSLIAYASANRGGLAVVLIPPVRSGSSRVGQRKRSAFSDRLLQISGVLNGICDTGTLAAPCERAAITTIGNATEGRVPYLLC